MAFWNKKKTEPEVTPAPRKVAPAPQPAQPVAVEPVKPAPVAPVEPEQTEQKKKRRGKPQDYTKLTRNSQVKIRLTEDEVAKLKSAAAAANMSMADFIMAGIDQERRIVLPGGGKIRTELYREGKNLNQALMLCHKAMREGQQPDIASVMAAVAKVEQNLDRLAELIGNWDIDISQKVMQQRKEGQ